MDDMLDVVHVLFEEDATPLWEEHQKAKSHLRSSIYQQLYGQEYRYRVREGSASSEPMSSPEMMDLPPEQMPVKPYIPPTDPEDLESVLGAPAG